MIAALGCTGVHRYLGEAESRVHVLRGITLDVPTGEVHAIVGPSGCGKSTLLYVLGLLDVADEGQIIIGGENVSGLSDNDLSQKRNELIGFVFQFHFLMHEFTVLENVTIPMRRLGKLGLGEMRTRASMLLDAVGLGDKLNRPANHLSGGEQQRVAIARALINEPDLILADEPTGNLDSHTGEEIIELLCTLRDEKHTTLIMATHDARVAARAPKVIELVDGQIADGPAPPLS